MFSYYLLVDLLPKPITVAFCDFNMESEIKPFDKHTGFTLQSNLNGLSKITMAISL